MSAETKSKLALITGASSGIGRAFAFVLAKNGWNVVLHGRRKEALDQIAREIRENFSVSAEVLVVDLCEADSADTIVSELKQRGLTLDALISNAGFTVHGPFVETSLERELAMLQAHIGSVVALLKYVGRDMKQRGTGRILNVGSVYSFVPVPNQSIYGATKAFQGSLVSALANELEGSGVVVCGLYPGVTKTSIRKSAGITTFGSRFAMEAERVAEIGYQGLMDGKKIIIPGNLNKLFVLLTRFIPKSLLSACVRFVSYTMRGLRPSSSPS